MKKKEWKKAFSNAMTDALDHRDALNATLDVVDELVEENEIWRRRAEEAREIAHTLKHVHNLPEGSFWDIVDKVIARHTRSLD